MTLNEDDIVRWREPLSISVGAVADLIAERVSERLASDWRLIETAPKDGTLILAWQAKGPILAYWGRNGDINAPAWLGGHCHVNHIDQPTHWMPLPRAPRLGKNP